MNQRIDTTTAATSASPTKIGERLGILDAVRGVALGGILLANLTSFFGVYMMDLEARQAMPASGLGESVLFGIDWFVEGKFYSVFSILLGIGFALQCQRALARGSSRAEFGRFFRRRMTVLIAIGLIHMYALWCGDILALYGVMGLLLPWLAIGGNRTRAIGIVILLLIPAATHLLVNATDGRMDPRPPFAEAADHVRESLGGEGRSSLELFANGTGADYRAWNIGFAVSRPGTYLQGGRPTKVLALFLIGAWIGATILFRLDSLRRQLTIVAVVGAVIGLPTSFVYAVIKAKTASTFMVSTEGLVQTAAYTLGTTPLALSYLALAAIGWRTSRIRTLLEWFVPLGRMALSVYISQSMIQMILFTGYGFGLAGKAPVALLPLIAAAILIVQRAGCVWWLGRYQQGPLEWVWRKLTYRQSEAAHKP